VHLKPVKQRDALKSGANVWCDCAHGLLIKVAYRLRMVNGKWIAFMLRFYPKRFTVA